MEGLLFGLASHQYSKETLASMMDIEVPLLQRYRQYLSVISDVEGRAAKSKKKGPLVLEDDDLARIWGVEAVYNTGKPTRTELEKSLFGEDEDP